MSTATTTGFILMLLLHFEYSEPVNFSMRVLPRKTTHLGTVKECTNLSQKLGETWALPNGRESAELLTAFMADKNLTSVWLGIRRSSMESWQWINGDTDERFKDAPGTHGCAVLTLSQVIRPHECADETQGFLCKIPENTSCPKTAQESYCTSAHGKIYWFRCQVKNWFSARRECQGHGGDLVVLKNNQIKDILQPIAEHQPIRCTSYFIGLHREYWLRTTPKGGDELITKENWATGEPTNKDCALFTVDSSSKTGAWRAVSCFSKHQGLCEQYNWSYEESTRSNIRNDTPCVNISAVSCDSQDIRNDTPCVNISAVSCYSQESGCIDVGMIVALAVVPVVTLVLVSTVACYLYMYMEQSKLKLRRNSSHDMEMTTMAVPVDNHMALQETAQHATQPQQPQPHTGSIPEREQAATEPGAQPLLAANGPDS